jgi:3-oxoacyl-[acyl-carrier protein] reductase
MKTKKVRLITGAARGIGLAIAMKALQAGDLVAVLARSEQILEVAEVVEWVARSRYMAGAFVPADGGLLSSFGMPGKWR